MSKNNTVGLKMVVYDFFACPICEEEIRKGQVCMPLCSNQRVVGYAHKRCSDIVDQAMAIIEELSGGEDGGF